MQLVIDLKRLEMNKTAMANHLKEDKSGFESLELEAVPDRLIPEANG